MDAAGGKISYTAFMVKKLNPTEQHKMRQQLNGWRKTRGREAIEKTFLFKDFNDAFAWMTKIALRAEQMNHHPEWENVYNRVHVVLTTHDVSGLSERDGALALFMNQAAGESGKKTKAKAKAKPRPKNTAKNTAKNKVKSKAQSKTKNKTKNKTQNKTKNKVKRKSKAKPKK